MSSSILSTPDEPEYRVHQANLFQFIHLQKGSEVVENCSAVLLRELLDILPQVTITATGSSMHPFIRSGSRITLCRIKNTLSLREGDIVLFENSSGSLLLHRIITKCHHKKNIQFQTKGDNRFVPDVPIFPGMIIAKANRIENDNLLPGKRLVVDLESRKCQLCCKIIAWNSRFNIYLRCRRCVSKLRNFFSINGKDISNLTS